MQSLERMRKYKMSKFSTKCITCEDLELEKKRPRRYEWYTKTENQANLIRSVHISNQERHEVKVQRID